ncbi:unnamed protein product [Mytilus edulis]|uniref:SUEL-type lectin domain-containing protein n=1 Tax=Mytilus edulis TaxID=6550 RepID=A0A8S3S1N8_MYTED|nr:unnamed protein product [Mytilus edulis]
MDDENFAHRVDKLIVDAITLKVKNGKVAYFRCSDGQVVSVTEATYEKGSCGDSTALMIVQGLANGKTSYDLPVAKSTFVSTCAANVNEKLKVKYDCVSATETATTPNADTTIISCIAGQYITITKALYGDTANNCYDVNAFSIVQSSCNNKVFCLISVDSATFPGSTCSPTGSESLSVAYSCTQVTGQVYTHWGSTTCGSTAQLLYSAYRYTIRDIEDTSKHRDYRFTLSRDIEDTSKHRDYRFTLSRDIEDTSKHRDYRFTLSRDIEDTFKHRDYRFTLSRDIEDTSKHRDYRFTLSHIFVLVTNHEPALWLVDLKVQQDLVVTTFVCQPHRLTQVMNRVPPNQKGGQLYGIQLGLDTSDATSPFDTSKNGYVVDCAVCQILANPAVFMQAATNTCPTGWTVVYTGYLMSEIAAGVTATSKGYACLDKDAPLSTDSSSDNAFVYPVEGKCGTLSCPNYIDNAELTCVVCSK